MPGNPVRMPVQMGDRLGIRAGDNELVTLFNGDGAAPVFFGGRLMIVSAHLLFRSLKSMSYRRFKYINVDIFWSFELDAISGHARLA